MPPTGGNLSIASVTTIECYQLTPNSRQLTFTPVYAGGNGSTITFQIRNESLPTTAGGPYSLRLYTDNPTITLLATQAGSPQVTYAYNWLAVCGSSTARLGIGEPTESSLQLSLKAYPNPVTDAVTIEALAPISGNATFEVIDLTGLARQTHNEHLTEGINQIEFRLSKLPAGNYLIRCRDSLGHQATVRVNRQ